MFSWGEAGEVLQVALRLGIGMAGVVNYVGVSYAKFRSGEAGVVRYHGASHSSVSFGKAG